MLHSGTAPCPAFDHSSQPAQTPSGNGKQTGMEMRANANGLMLNYSLDGPEGAPLVTLSHSLAANLGMWEPQIEALAAHYRVLRFDTRGHGGSDVTDGPYDMALLAGDVVALLDALGVARTHFIGLSLGGMVGQTLALDWPDHLLSIALCDTAPAMPPEAEAIWDQRIAFAEAEGMTALVEPTIERWFTAPFRSAQSVRIEPVREMIKATPLAGFVGCCRAIQRLNLIDRLPGIDLPTLIVVGEDDQGTPVAASEEIHARIAGSELVIPASAAHLSNWEQPAAFNTAIGTFLSRVADA